MSLAFAIMAAINGSTGTSATLSHGLYRTTPRRRQSGGREILTLHGWRRMGPPGGSRSVAPAGPHDRLDCWNRSEAPVSLACLRRCESAASSWTQVSADLCRALVRGSHVMELAGMFAVIVR